MKKTVIWLVALVMLVHLPLWDFFLGEDDTYSNKDGSYRYEEITGKGGSFNTVMLNYGGFLATHPEKDQGDNNRYRTFTLKPWRFWEWREMLFHSGRFRLPYLDTGRIKK